MLEIGTVIYNRYRIVREIGSGGMGSIYQVQVKKIGINS